MHTAIETTAFADTAFLLDILNYTDWLFIDLKHMDSTAHKAQTGVGNDIILKNIRAIATANWPGKLMIRMPVIPGFNDSPENIEATAAFLREQNLGEIHILPFHRLGTSKYAQLGLTYAHASQPAPTAEAMQAIRHQFETCGLTCYVDAESPY
jgi:pyruvate formate lyase activating enzyme